MKLIRSILFQMKTRTVFSIGLMCSDWSCRKGTHLPRDVHHVWLPTNHIMCPFRHYNGSGSEDDPVRVGAEGVSGARVLRIVHISDTHLQHGQLLSQGLIPEGDVLVHSGDFTNCSLSKRWNSQQEFIKDTDEINQFFGSLPHKYKIFVGGNHDLALSYYSKDEVQERLSNAIYLQNSGTEIEGVKIWGSPCNLWRWWALSSAFALNEQDMAEQWKLMPTNSDVIITHNPPFRILDRRRKKMFQPESTCSECPDANHPGHLHWGCPHLRDKVLQEVKPKLHMFGHTHGYNGVECVDNVVFSNGAMSLNRKGLLNSARVIDYYIKPEDALEETETAEDTDIDDDYCDTQPMRAAIYNN